MVIKKKAAWCWLCLELYDFLKFISQIFDNIQQI